jgi:hypothetical protein
LTLDAIPYSEGATTLTLVAIPYSEGATLPYPILQGRVGLGYVSYRVG